NPNRKQQEGYFLTNTITVAEASSSGFSITTITAIFASTSATVTSVITAKYHSRRSSAEETVAEVLAKIAVIVVIENPEDEASATVMVF
ncbi:hypothetical protein E4U61_007718, partial [Claviceps capensis]